MTVSPDCSSLTIRNLCEGDSGGYMALFVNAAKYLLTQNVTLKVYSKSGGDLSQLHSCSSSVWSGWSRKESDYIPPTPAPQCSANSHLQAKDSQ